MQRCVVANGPPVPTRSETFDTEATFWRGKRTVGTPVPTRCETFDTDATFWCGKRTVGRKRAFLREEGGARSVTEGARVTLDSY